MWYSVMFYDADGNLLGSFIANGDDGTKRAKRSAKMAMPEDKRKRIARVECSPCTVAGHRA